MVGDDVVAHIAATVAAGQGHGLAVGHVLVVEQAGGAHRHCIAGDPACGVGGVGRGCPESVVFLVGSRDARDGDGLGRDIGCGGGTGRTQHIVAGQAVIGAIVEAIARGRHVLADTHVFGVKRGSAVVDRQGFADDAGAHASGVGNRRTGGAVILFVICRKAGNRQGFGGDACR